MGKGEKLAAEVLERDLPSSWWVVCNKELYLPSGETAEVDFIAVGERCIFAIDEKSWHGTIRGNDNGWISDYFGYGLGNPISAANAQARYLRGYVQHKNSDVELLKGSEHFVFGRVLLTDFNVSIKVNDKRAETHVLRATSCVEALTEYDRGHGILLGKTKSRIVNSLRDVPNRPKIPRRIGDDYEVRERLKTPGFTNCYLAQHDDGTVRILRVIEKPETVIDKRYQAGKNFALREYDVLRALTVLGRTPGVESYFSFDQGQFWAVPIQVPEGCSIRSDRIHQTPLESRIQSVVIDAFRGIAEIQEKGVIHRAITPDRVLVGPNDHVMFTDFFAARIENAETIADRLVFPGPEPYAAPELKEGAIFAQRSSDTYGLAASLWFWVTGEEPDPETPECDVTPYRPDLDEPFRQWLTRFFSRCFDINDLKRPAPAAIADELSRGCF